MPDPIDWTTAPAAFYPGATELKTPESTRLVAVMSATGTVHADEFGDPPPHNQPHLPPHEILSTKTKVGKWMRIRVGTHKSNGERVVIIYHRLQHFPDDNRWSVSVGVHKKVFQFEAAAGDFNNLAQSILDQLYIDATTNLPKDGVAQVAELVIYDHIYTRADAIDHKAPDTERKKTDIGTLGFVAQVLMLSDENKKKWKKPDTVEAPRPEKDGKPIPGWGRDKQDGTPVDTTVIRTILVPKPIP